MPFGVNGSRKGRKIMQPIRQAGNSGNPAREPIETAVQMLANLDGHGESLAEVAHDARNMVTALGLYCDLLEEPGVLAVPFAHYGTELRLVAAASRRLVEKLAALDARAVPPDGNTEEPCDAASQRRTERSQPGVRGDAASKPGAGKNRKRNSETRFENEPATSTARGAPTVGELDPAAALRSVQNLRLVNPAQRWEAAFVQPVHNLAAELLANRNLLSALAGPGIVVTVDTEGGACPVRLTAEDLTRVLVNLVRNAVEAMPSGGRIQIGLHERSRKNGTGDAVVLAVEDNGPGIAPAVLDKIFNSGFSTHTKNASGGWPSVHRGLGLAITRSIVESAGGTITASNRAQGGARFEIELPARTSLSASDH